MAEQWLYRNADLILGPVPAAQVIEKIYAGELDGKSEVQLMGSGSFRRLTEIEHFKVHLAKADVKRKVDRMADQHTRDRNNRRNVTLTIAFIIIALVAGGVIAAGQYFAVHTPGGSDQYADLISVDPPVVSRARGANNEELIDYPGAPGQPKAPNPGQPAQPRRPRTPGEPKPKPGEEDPDGMQMGERQQEGIREIVAKHQRGLFPCFRTIMKPGVRIAVPIEFTVAEGKVTKLWIDNPDLKGDAALKECLLQELGKFPFKNAQSGSVQQTFNVGKSG